MLKELIEAEIKKMITGEGGDEKTPMGSAYKIIIAQRGFVFAGRYTEQGEYIVLEEAVVIRRWGTTKGLGELAKNGNMSDSVIDSAGVVRLHKLSVVAMLDCEGVIHANT